MKHTAMVVVFLFLSISIAHSAGDFTGEWVGVKGKAGMCRMKNNVSINKRGGKYILKNSGSNLSQGGYMECIGSEGIILSYEDECLVDKVTQLTACLEKDNLIINMIDGEFIYAKGGRSSKEVAPMPPVKGAVNPAKYVGMWKYDEFGVKHYARISKDKSGRFKYEEGYNNDGKIIWLENTKDGENRENIYMTLSNGKLNGEFVSNNFRETHGIDFKYKITLNLKSENRLHYSINGEKAMEAVRIGD